MDDQKALQDLLQREDEIVNAAIESVKRIEPFHARLGRSGILGWLWRPDREEISSQQAEVKLRENAHGIVRQIRKRLWAMPHINAARAGVIVHVGIVIGAETLLHNDALWRALQVADYEEAQDTLLRTSWPSLAGDDEHARARVLALARQLRTGVMPVQL